MNRTISVFVALIVHIFRIRGGLFQQIYSIRIDHEFNDTVGQFAEWVAEYVFRNQMELWGDQMEQELTGTLDAQTERGAAASLLALLPEEFTASDLIKLRARKGQSVKASAVSMVLNRWRNNHRIVKISDTIWKKTNY